MKSVIAIWLLFAAVLAFPTEDIDFEESNSLKPRITGGEVAEPNAFPYQVGMIMILPPTSEGGSALQLWCGGSLISNEYILTAAHCLYGMTKIVVILGAHNIQSQTEQGRIILPVTPKNFIIHERYDPQLSQNDIALIKLPAKVPLSHKIELIKLPKRNEEYSMTEGKTVTSTGWGKMGDNIDMSTVLRFVNLKILDNLLCRLQYPYTYSASRMLCVSGTEQKSVCPGDSGGPLVVDDNGSKTLIGLTSYGRKECQKGYPTVFTKVSAYLDWISKNTGIQV